MSFTTPCFIKKNTPELRKKLSTLGYRMICPNEYENLVCCDNWVNDCEDVSDLDAIDCGTNEPLLLAIAALRDDTSIGQYWVFDEDFENYKKGDFVMGAFYRCSCYCHVATIPELREHFKTEE